MKIENPVQERNLCLQDNWKAKRYNLNARR